MSIKIEDGTSEESLKWMMKGAFSMEIISDNKIKLEDKEYTLITTN